MKFRNNKYTFIASLILLTLFCACEKVTFDHSEGKGASFVMAQGEQRIGEEDEDPIIQGIVQDAELNPMVNAAVGLIPNGENTSVDSDTTNANGEFEVQAAPGWYFIRVTPLGSNAVETAAFELLSDTTMVITVE